jgi:16S rRNA (adenine1518-N6/adenine1519-N6)-dimethyltransferase
VGRRLGQHFLFDPAILDRIVDAVDPHPADQVVEIGPGKGTLTQRLAPRVGWVVAIERDGALAEEIRTTAPGNCRVIHGDALEVDWHAQLPVPSPAAPYKVAGNIPYAITTPLIDKALIEPLPASITFLVQKEVAERVGAAPGSKAYGALSVGVQAVALVERLFAVRAGSFRPPPKVDSAVIRLTPRTLPLTAAEEREPFRRFVAGLFGQRRRQLTRALRTVTDLPPADIAELLASLGVDPAARPEVLAPQEFVDLFRLQPR